MILKFPQDIYFYYQQYSNYRVLSEVANYDFDYLKLKNNKIILNKINQIAKKNKVLLNPNFDVVDLTKIKNIQKKLKIKL